MIKQITVTNHLSDSLTIDLARPELSGLAITKIDGLGPVKANVNIQEYTLMDGGIYNSSRLPVRNITINIRFIEYILNGIYYTVEEIREKAYLYFPVKNKVKLQITTDRKTLYTEGIVEANEPDMFSAESSTSISILCADPIMYGTYDDEQYKFELCESPIPTFEFPFCADTLGSTKKYLEFGYVVASGDYAVYYPGTYTTGIKMTIRINQSIPVGFYISNTITNEKITFNGAYSAGDVINVNSEYGKKKVTKIPAGTTTETNILSSIAITNSCWLHLVPGYNIFDIYIYNTSSTSFKDSAITATISFNPGFVGV